MRHEDGVQFYSSKLEVWTQKSMYEFKHYLFASIHFYSILLTSIPGSKTPFANESFSFFTTTMAWSGFGLYHDMCHHDTGCRRIDIAPTLGAMTHALGFGVCLLQPELYQAY